MTTEPMKRYEPDPYCDSAGWKVIRMQEDKDGQYLDRRDMPVESLRAAVHALHREAHGYVGTPQYSRIKTESDQHIAALERLLGACE